MKYKSKLHTNEFKRLEYDDIEIEFTDEQVEKLLFLSRIAKDHDGILAIRANVEPLVRSLLNTEYIDTTKLNNEWDNSMYASKVMVTAKGWVDITWTNIYTSSVSWADGAQLSIPSPEATVPHKCCGGKLGHTSTCKIGRLA